jgi:hypothetical protein
MDVAVRWLECAWNLKRTIHTHIHPPGSCIIYTTERYKVVLSCVTYLSGRNCYESFFQYNTDNLEWREQQKNKGETFTITYAITKINNETKIPRNTE